MALTHSTVSFRSMLTFLIVWATFQQQDLCCQQTDEKNCIEQEDGDH